MRGREGRRRPGRTLAVGVAAGLAVGLTAGCLDLAIVADVTFPSAVPGLPAGQPWVSLPVGVWLTESGVEPRAISACFAPDCRPRAAVGLFRATGPEAARLAAGLADPAAFLPAAPPASSGRRTNPRRPGSPRAVAARVAAEPYREGAFSGVAVRLSRPDGTRPAAGIVMSASRAGTLTVVVVVTADEPSARSLARDVARHL